MSKQTVSVSAVSELLDQIPQERREQFDKQLIEHLYQKYQSHAVNDLDAIDALRQKMEGRKVLVLAPGKSIAAYQDRIQEFIDEEDPPHYQRELCASPVPV